MILAPADPDRLILYSCAVAIYQGFQYEDKAGKMGLLKYSTGEFLDNLAAFKGVKRNEAVPASTILRFTLAAVLDVYKRQGWSLIWKSQLLTTECRSTS